MLYQQIHFYLSSLFSPFLSFALCFIFLKKLAILYCSAFICLNFIPFSPSFVVNSFFWNCRFKYGLRDYFVKSISETNNVFTAQIIRTMGNTKGMSLVEQIKNQIITANNLPFYRKFFYAGLHVFNNIYKLFNKQILFGTDLFDTIRNKTFLSSISFLEYSSELKQLLVPNSKVCDFIYKDPLFKELKKTEYIGVHIRRGDKISTGEMENLELNKYVDEIKKIGLNTVYIATDDVSVVEYIRDKCDNIYIYTNPHLKQFGFVENTFNHKSHTDRYYDTLILLYDIFVLISGKKFIGTYSSNLSRIIPCFLGLNNCVSLDEEWSVC